MLVTTLVLIGIDNISSLSSTPAEASSVAAEAPAAADDLEAPDAAGIRAAVDAVASAADFSVQPKTSLALQ